MWRGGPRLIGVGALVTLVVFETNCLVDGSHIWLGIKPRECQDLKLSGSTGTRRLINSATMDIGSSAVQIGLVQ